jgi:hypothetical protein
MSLTRSAGSLVEDERAHRPITGTDIQDGDRSVLGEREEIAHQLESLGPDRVLDLLPSHPLFDVGL